MSQSGSLVLLLLVLCAEMSGGAGRDVLFGRAPAPDIRLVPLLLSRNPLRGGQPPVATALQRRSEDGGKGVKEEVGR